jgi:N6-L-threonylcarbamoyladenine synthase
VGANKRLRTRLKELADKAGASLYFPRPEFCTDNGAMIALAGCLRLAAGRIAPEPMAARAHWELSSVELGR